MVTVATTTNTFVWIPPTAAFPGVTKNRVSVLGWISLAHYDTYRRFSVAFPRCRHQSRYSDPVAAGSFFDIPTPNILTKATISLLPENLVRHQSSWRIFLCQKSCWTASELDVARLGLIKAKFIPKKWAVHLMLSYVQNFSCCLPAAYKAAVQIFCNSYGSDAVYFVLTISFSMRAAPINLNIFEHHDGCIFALHSLRQINFSYPKRPCPPTILPFWWLRLPFLA